MFLEWNSLTVTRDIVGTETNKIGKVLELTLNLSNNRQTWLKGVLRPAAKLGLSCNYHRFVHLWIVTL
jgi:hypothetical protein